MAHKILYEALLAETAEEGRRAVEAMRAPDVGELVSANLHFYLADGEGRPVPLVEARGRATAAVVAAIPGAMEAWRDGHLIWWNVPSLLDATPGRESRCLRYGILRHDSFRLYTRQCHHHLVLVRSGLAEAALLAQYHAHVRLEIDVVPPEPEAVGRLLADLTREMHDRGAVRRGHTFRMCPTSLFEAKYRMSEASLAAIDYVLPLVKDMRVFLETRPEDPDKQSHLLGVSCHGEPIPLLVMCPGGPAGARDIIKHAEQKRLRQYERTSRKCDGQDIVIKWYEEDKHVTDPNYY